ncbi:MAG: DUF1415 domain-containing protein [Burkholderiales bacterium]|nr:DUF1415 domain-containing protein [Burkholderiales bacterium]
MSETHVENVPQDLLEVVLHDMRHWLEQAVIGLNLCPFAKSVHIKGQIQWCVSAARDEQAVRSDLVRELLSLQEIDPAQRDTTLLVLPLCFEDFLDFNAFLAVADAVLAELGLLGELQIASFHPQYQFAGADADDITNCTNRAPYPVLHLLREASIDRAVEAFPEAETIYEKNMQVLEQLGHAGWDALGIVRHAKSPRTAGEAGDEV